MDKQSICDFLITHNGDLNSKLWQRACGRNGESTRILRWFDQLGLTRLEGARLKHRVLAVTVKEAVATIEQAEYEGDNKCKPGRKASVSQFSTDFLTVLDDPTCLFTPGNTIPANQVFGGQYPTPDEFPVGIRFEYQGAVLVNDARRGLCVVGRL